MSFTFFVHPDSVLWSFQRAPCLEGVLPNTNVFLQLTPSAFSWCCCKFCQCRCSRAGAGWFANKIPNYQIAITVQVLLAPDSSITTLLTTLISVSWEKTLWSLSKYSHHFGGSILESHGSSNYFLSKSRRQHVTSCTISQVRNTPANKQPGRAFFITATFGNCLYY